MSAINQLIARGSTATPATSYAQGRSDRQKNRLAEIQLDQAETGIRDQKAARKSISEYFADVDPRLAEIARHKPESAVKLYEFASKASEQERKLAAERIENATREASAILTVPEEQRPQEWPKIRDALEAKYPGMAQQIPDQYDPTAISMMLAGGEKSAEFLMGDNGPLVEVNTGDGKRETKFEETVGKGFGDQYIEMQQAANEARTSNVRLSRAEQLVEGMNTGTLAPTVQNIKRVFKSAGYDPEAIGMTDDVGAGEALQALGTQFALEAVNQTKGAVSDREMAMFESTAPGLSRSPEGNKLLIEMAKRLNDLKIQQASLARDYYRKNGTYDEGFYDQLDQFHAQNPLFTENIQTRVDQIMSRNEQLTGPTGTNPVAVNPQTGEKVQWNPETGNWDPM